MAGSTGRLAPAIGGIVCVSSSMVGLTGRPPIAGKGDGGAVNSDSNMGGSGAGGSGSEKRSVGSKEGCTKSRGSVGSELRIGVRYSKSSAFSSVDASCKFSSSGGKTISSASIGIICKVSSSESVDTSCKIS